MITPAQIRAGRALVNAKQSELAKAAGISLATLNNIERGLGDPRASTLDAIEKALVSAGVTLERDGVTETVSLTTISRPTAYDTFSASQRVLEVLTQDILLKIEKIIFFARWPRESHDEGEANKICLLIEGNSRKLLFDQADFSLTNSARVAEVSGILLAAFMKYHGKLFYLPDVQEDMTLAPLSDTVAHLEQQQAAPLEHPRQLIDVADDWDGHIRGFADRSGHPLQGLVHFVEGKANG